MSDVSKHFHICPTLIFQIRKIIISVIHSKEEPRQKQCNNYSIFNRCAAYINHQLVGTWENNQRYG